MCLEGVGNLVTLGNHLGVTGRYRGKWDQNWQGGLYLAVGGSAPPEFHDPPGHRGATSYLHASGWVVGSFGEPWQHFSVKKLIAFSDSGLHSNAKCLAYKAAVSCVSSNSGLTVRRCSSKGSCSAGYRGFRQWLCNANEWEEKILGIKLFFSAH